MLNLLSILTLVFSLSVLNLSVSSLIMSRAGDQEFHSFHQNNEYFHV